MGKCRGLHIDRLGFAVLAGFMAWAPGAFSATFTVGSGPNCTHSTVAAAVVTSEGSAGPDTIRVTRSATYTQQAISFHVAQEVTITGGFADCSTNVEDGIYTTLDGSGGSHATVMTINADAGSTLHLRKLLITGGDVTSVNAIAGGGIYYTGNGVLDIANSSISGNTGAYGGGINVGGADQVDIGATTTIANNTAIYNGGGIFSNNSQTTIRGDNILIDFNTAIGVSNGTVITGGYGGGIHIRACLLSSTVQLASPGVGTLGVLYGNSARYGGGVFLEGAQGCASDGDASLLAYSIDANRRTKIQANQASVAGGGVYTSPNDYSHNQADASFWNASIVENTAPRAAALYLGADPTLLGFGFGSSAHFNDGAAPAGAITCFSGKNCGEISDNVSSDGQVIYGEEGNFLTMERMTLTGNHGTELIRLQGLSAGDSLFADNGSTGRLIETHFPTVTDSTITGNTIGGQSVFGIDTDGGLTLSGSVVWQPGVSVLNNDGGSPQVHDVIVNETGTLAGAGNTHLLIAEPRFADPIHGDYALTAASPAVDFAQSTGSVDRDLNFYRRDIDLMLPNRYGPRDLGALERQPLAPLVQNGTFDANAYTWPEVTVGASSWDATQNIAGPSGSGALHVSYAGSSLTARKQCIHLPGPGIYTLNGWGKSTGSGPVITGSYVSLGWEYRSAGSESCTGSVTSSGSLLLANNGTWRKPATPASIQVAATEWTRDSSIVVYLVVTDGNGGVGRQPAALDATLNGWFDGITLDVLTDHIFANGFE